MNGRFVGTRWLWSLLSIVALGVLVLRLGAWLDVGAVYATPTVGCVNNTCGDGCCDPTTEDPCSCPEDCAGSGYCGDGCCDQTVEDFCGCPGDCAGNGYCGDGCCDATTEDFCSCPGDCAGQGTCGDGCCDANNENPCSCPGDCAGQGTCGDGCCDASNEDPCSCPGDCAGQGTCGDGCCDASGGETCDSCSTDCGTCATTTTSSTSSTIIPATTTTSSTTTSTTTTSSTTTTLPPCSSLLAPACNGTCPAGAVCVNGAMSLNCYCIVVIGVTTTTAPPATTTTTSSTTTTTSTSSTTTTIPGCASPCSGPGDCLDQNSCTADECIAGCCVHVPVCKDAYLCYTATPSKGGPAFSPVPNVHIQDPFEDLYFTVTGPLELCNPASVGGGPIADPDVHFDVDGIVPSDKKAHRNTTKNVTVTTDLGTSVVDLVVGDKLFLPAAKSLAGPPAALDPLQHAVDHFKCYDVKLSKGQKLPKNLQITLADQFTQQSKLFKVTAIEHLCPVAQKNGEPVHDPCGALFCYQVKSSDKKFKKLKGVWTRDQFGLEERDVTATDDVCLPATILSPASLCEQMGGE